MAINLPNPGVFESQIGTLFVSFRNDYQSISNLNNYIASIGGATALQAAPFNFSTEDANALVAALGNVVNLTGITAAIDDGQPFWGGQ
jgi:hypothetical protein